MRVTKIFKTRLIINNFKARFRVISKKLFKKSSVLFDDMNIKQRNHYFKFLSRKCNYNHWKRIKIKDKAEDKQHQFEKQCIMLSNSGSVKSSSNIAIINKVIMHFAFMILFSIERKEKKVLIIRLKNLARDKCAFQVKTMNNLNFTKFINLTKTKFNFDSNNENVIYRLNIDDFVKIINDK